MPEFSTSLRPVLVVEADEVVQRHLASSLADLGYEPVVTASVTEALAALSRTRFLLSLVSLDLDGADGNNLLRRLKVEGGNPGAVIVIANGGGLKRMSEAADLGAHEVLQRPFAAEDLENVIKSAMARSPRSVGSSESPEDRTRKLHDELSLWQS